MARALGAVRLPPCPRPSTRPAPRRRSPCWGSGGWWSGAAIALTALLYAAVIADALRTEIPADLGLDLSPRETEALLISALIFLGVNLAWVMFTEREAPAA